MNPVKHEEPITLFDLEKIKQFFDKNKHAQNLSQHVWFSCTLHLGLRGREIQERVMTSDVEVCRDETGEYAKLSWDFATKNYKGGYGSTRRDVGVGRIQDSAQILSIKVMLQHLHPDCPRLFQRLGKNYNPKDAICYCNAPLGKFSLDKLMPDISKAAELSQVYTNQCLRATVVSMLSSQGEANSGGHSQTGRTVSPLFIFGSLSPPPPKRHTWLRKITCSSIFTRK